VTPDLSSVARDDPERAWERWSTENPHFAIDPRFAWAAGVRHGRRSMLSDSARWVGLEPTLVELLAELRRWGAIKPMLAEILDELLDARMERDAEFDEADMDVGADLTGVDGSDQAAGVLADVVPDLTVGSSDAQVDH